MQIRMFEAKVLESIGTALNSICLARQRVCCYYCGFVGVIGNVSWCYVFCLFYLLPALSLSLSLALSLFLLRAK